MVPSCALPWPRQWRWPGRRETAANVAAANAAASPAETRREVAMALARRVVESGDTTALRELGEMVEPRDADGVAGAVVREVPGVLRECVGRGAADVVAVTAMWKLSRARDNGVMMVEADGLVDVLVRAAGAQTGVSTSNPTHAPPSYECKRSALGALANLACSRTQLLHFPGLMDMLIHAVREPETAEVQDTAMAVLANLALAPPNQVSMFATPGLVEMLVQSASNGELTRDAKVRALITLSSLASSGENRTALAATPGVMDVMMRAVEAGEAKDGRRPGLMGLVHLVAHAENLVPLCGKPGLVDLLMRVVESHETGKVKELALTALSNLAVAAQNKRVLFTTPGLVALLMRTVKARVSNKLEANATRMLASLASASENRVAMFATPGLMELLTLEAKRTDRACRSYAFGALLYLAMEPDNRLPMVAWPGLRQFMVDAAGRASKWRELQTAAFLLESAALAAAPTLAFLGSRMPDDNGGSSMVGRRSSLVMWRRFVLDKDRDHAVWRLVMGFLSGVR